MRQASRIISKPSEGFEPYILNATVYSQSSSTLPQDEDTLVIVGVELMLWPLTTLSSVITRRARLQMIEKPGLRGVLALKICDIMTCVSDFQILLKYTELE